MRTWEDICLRCSLCCHEKTVWDDVLEVDLSSPCEFLDPDSHLCRVYDERFKTTARCLKVNPLRAMFSSALPPSCGYVRWAQAHHVRFCRERELVITEDALK